jgi:hypothetical protein
MDVPEEDFGRDVEWPPPAPQPDFEPVDAHRSPLDDDDVRWLGAGDPRRIEVEERRRKKKK